MTIFNSFMTNVVAKHSFPGLEGIYAMHYFYYDLSEFEDKASQKPPRNFDLYKAKYNTPVDSYAAIAYTAYSEMFRGFEGAKSFEPKKVAAALMANNGAFTCVKGFCPMARGSRGGIQVCRLLGQGKGPSEQKNAWICLRLWVTRAVIR